MLTILRTKIAAAENQPGEGTVNLDIPANVLWHNTEIYVNKGQQLTILPGSGEYNLKGGNPDRNAFAYSIQGNQNCVINGEYYGTLAAKINDGEPFLVTMRDSNFIVPTNGTLCLTVNDCVDCYEYNSGFFDVLIDLYNAP